ncbi:MAG: RNA 2'-phosphotransferase [Gemmatimonadales bacterium]|nr:RNA 2'-phosphotransferase [Gemmatimonadales bacterium]NIN11818.1 RNA 2'-phosphotransferase [Gemmatimonadales bacterium]NIN50368.1 RNA 2'-phosphotransferase [Gemmatimonadales bacterium]NIP07832.1 RNA 2'-phosphotransferase [Gemmatimonadales bacterium]NIR00540.1 RNA 2'-phosphotransferase [Gemmatimonadales bacterium]
MRNEGTSTNRLQLERLSRTVAHALRHAPSQYELEVDEEGWVPVGQLLEALKRRRRAWRRLTLADLETMIARSPKRRFEIAGDRIRALYGHSLPALLLKHSSQPPELLYHGTAPETLEDIRREGLQPMGRHHVHLSTSVRAAQEVGKRKSPQPIVLVVHAGQAHRDGVPFYEGNEEVWLADEVPAEYLAEE